MTAPLTLVPTPLLPTLLEICREFGVLSATMSGSAAQVSSKVGGWGR